MRVLVFETGSGGHALNYQRLLLPAIAQLSDELIVVLRKDALEGEEAQVQLRSMPDGIQWDPALEKPNDSVLKRELAFRRSFCEAVAKHQPDHIYFPTADAISQLCGIAAMFGHRDILRGMEAEVALHRCGFAYPTTSLVKRAMRRLGYWAHTHAPWTRVFCVDVLAYEWVQKRGGAFAKRNFLLPDPIESVADMNRTEARHRLHIDSEGPLFGLVGVIDSRKGADVLLAAFKRAILPANAKLLLAGKHKARILELLRNEYRDLVQAGRILSIDRYLSIDELQYALGAMDLVCTPYMHQIALASITLRAVAANRPVLAASDGWCGRMVPAFGMGWTANPRDIDQFAAAMRSGLEAAESWCRNEACNSLLRFHTPENFVATYTARLHERIGQKPMASISWSEVAEEEKRG